MTTALKAVPDTDHPVHGKPDPKAKTPCVHCGTPISRQGMQGHVKNMHPDKYVPQRPGRAKKDAVVMPPANDVVHQIIKALYGDSIPTAHLPHVIAFMEATKTFLKAVGK